MFMKIKFFVAKFKAKIKTRLKFSMLNYYLLIQL